MVINKCNATCARARAPSRLRNFSRRIANRKASRCVSKEGGNEFPVWFSCAQRTTCFVHSCEKTVIFHMIHIYHMIAFTPR